VTPPRDPVPHPPAQQRGELQQGAALIAEAQAVADATGTSRALPVPWESLRGGGR